MKKSDIRSLTNSCMWNCYVPTLEFRKVNTMSRPLFNYVNSIFVFEHVFKLWACIYREISFNTHTTILVQRKTCIKICIQYINTKENFTCI